MVTLRSWLVRCMALVLIAFIASGCGLAYQINRNELLATATDADFGTPPPENHRELETRLILTSLVDPESARFDFGEVARDAIQGGFGSPRAVLVWRTSVQVNSKNRYGGYTGFQPWHFAWRDGGIIAIAQPVLTTYGARDGLWQYVR